MKQTNTKYSSIKIAELYEIANKYQLYKKSPNKWYLKLLYKIAASIALFLAKEESKKL